MIRINSIVTNEYMPADRKLQWPAAETEFIYLETFSSVHACWDTSQTILHPDDCLLVQRLTLHNCTSGIAVIRAIRIQVENCFSVGLKPVVSSSQPAKAAQLKELFYPLFHDQGRIAEVEASAGRLFHSWSDPATSDHFSTSLYGRMDSRLIKVNRYLRNHCEETITLQQLADLIKSNPVYLSNMYSKVFHISPIQHLQKMKMDKAKLLLSSTDMSVGAISQRLGYMSSSQFSDLFKRHYGMTPVAFRKNGADST